MVITGYSGQSYARTLPWRHNFVTVDIEVDEWLEMNPDIKDFYEYEYRWQDD